MWFTQDVLARPLESIRQTLTNVDSFLSLIFCSLFLKQLLNVADTTCLSRLFHILITLSEKKCWRRSVLHRFFFSFHRCRLVMHLLSNSKNVSNLIDDGPLTILNSSIRSRPLAVPSAPPATRVNLLTAILLLVTFCILYIVLRVPFCTCLYFP